MTRYCPGVSDGSLACRICVYDWPGCSVPLNSRRPTARSPMSQVVFFEKYAVSDQRPDAGYVPALVTVQRISTTSPDLAEAGTTIAVTWRSLGGGSSMTSGTVEPWSLLFSLAPSKIGRASCRDRG